MRVVAFLFPTMVLVLACNPTEPSDLLPRTHVDLTARLTTPTGSPVEGARVIIKTWPAADGQVDETFTGLLLSDADGLAARAAGPFATGYLDSVEVYATPPATCSWNPVQTMIRAIDLDTLPAQGMEVSVQLPDTLARARTELGVLCAQGTEMPSMDGLLSYDLFLQVQQVNGNQFSGSWGLQSSFYGWAEGVFSATLANGVMGILLTPTENHPLCNEIRLLGSIEPDGSWSMMDVVTDLVVPGWPCVPAGHQYRFFKSKLTSLP